MRLQLDGEVPIFIQLAEWLSDLILSGSIGVEEQIPSTTEIATSYKINPATALKGVNLLVDKGIIYKKRGLGMFVCEGAPEKIRKRRIDDFYEKYVIALLNEAEKLGLSRDEIISIILADSPDAKEETQ